MGRNRRNVREGRETERSGVEGRERRKMGEGLRIRGKDCIMVVGEWTSRA